MKILPPKQDLVSILGPNDFFLWEYYGKGLLGRIQGWIFRSRIKVLIKFLRKRKLECEKILDVGCGPMLVSYSLVNNTTGEYIGDNVS